MVTKKRKIDFTDESIKELMQETYHEIVDERQRALAAYKKVTKNMEENPDIAMVGKIANDLLKIVDGSIEKKIALLKLQTNVVYKNKGAGGESEDTPGGGGSGVITEADRKEIQEMLARTRVSNSDEDDTNVKKYN
jgi:hypothetical protein